LSLSNANNDLKHNLSNEEIDDEKHNNYDNECSNSDEDDEEQNYDTDTTQQNRIHDRLIETYDKPNYNSSDNEDP
jgi:hypothetical protein